MKIQVKSVLQILFLVGIAAMAACSIYFFNSFGKFDRPTEEYVMAFYGILTLIILACTLIVAGLVFGEPTESDTDSYIADRKIAIAVLSSVVATIFLACVLVALL